jgi:hypothetical protein
MIDPTHASDIADHAEHWDEDTTDTPTAEVPEITSVRLALVPDLPAEAEPCTGEHCQCRAARAAGDAFLRVARHLESLDETRALQ